MESILERYTPLPACPKPSAAARQLAYIAIAPGAYLAGLQSIQQCEADAVIAQGLSQLLTHEIQPLLALCPALCRTTTPVPDTTDSVSSYMPQAVATYKLYIIPLVKEYIRQYKKLPKWLTFSLAALLSYYRSVTDEDTYLLGQRDDGMTYEIHDTIPILTYFLEESAQDTRNYVWHILKITEIWDEDLTLIPGLATAVTTQLQRLDRQDTKTYMHHVTTL